ncbi:hypothetical protein C7458_11091 [Williamsia muralis]|nr:hypothetical protein C7458_11091 [Williamsia marianensis]
MLKRRQRIKGTFQTEPLLANHNLSGGDTILVLFWHEYESCATRTQQRRSHKRPDRRQRQYRIGTTKDRRNIDKTIRRGTEPCMHRLTDSHRSVAHLRIEARDVAPSCRGTVYALHQLLNYVNSRELSIEVCLRSGAIEPRLVHASNCYRDLSQPHRFGARND